MLKNKKIPFRSYAQTLGYFGITPFVLILFILYFFPYNIEEQLTNAFIIYLSVILSFIGGIYWGISMLKKSKKLLFFSVLPPIFCWLIVLFIENSFTKLITFFLLLNLILLFEFFFKRELNLTDWYLSLRLSLNLLLSLCIFFLVLS